MSGDQLRKLMLLAQAQQVLIPAFNIPYLPMIEPIMGVVRELDSFALIEVARLELEQFGARSLAAVAAEYEQFADDRHTALHLDHVPVIDEVGEQVDWAAMIQEGLDCGYPSVMIDGSRLPLEENIAVSRRVVELAAPYDATVEAELGSVLGHEPGPLPPYDELFASGLGFTSVEEAERLVTETGVDWLSVAIGNVHGAFRGAAAQQPKLQARLAIDHLRELAQATQIPLVLHGGSGIPAHYLQAAAREGIVKLNIGTELRNVYQQTLAATGVVTIAQEAVVQVVREIINDQLEIAGSASRLRQ